MSTTLTSRAPIDVEQAVSDDGETLSVQIDVAEVARDVAATLLTEVRRDPQLWARLMSHSGSATPLNEGSPAETITRLAIAAVQRGATSIALTPEEALDLAQALDEAACEPDRCVRGSCHRYAVSRGKCAYHYPEAWVD